MHLHNVCVLSVHTHTHIVEQHMLDIFWGFKVQNVRDSLKRLKSFRVQSRKTKCLIRLSGNARSMLPETKIIYTQG